MWVYDEAKAEENFFNFKITNRPTLKTIRRLIPASNEGMVREKNGEGIILDNPNDYALLRLLENKNFGERVTHDDYRGAINGDIMASWQSEQRFGVSSQLSFLFMKAIQRILQVLCLRLRHSPFVSSFGK